MLFSIIIPAKNEEHNIGKCLDSILAVDFSLECFEVIVVDNGSTDRTVQISKTKGVSVYHRPELTISGLRNFGASKANGKVLAFIDADCTVATNWLNEASRLIDQKDISCFGSPPEIPESATWVQRTWYLIRKKKEVVQNVQWLESMNMFIRRDLFSFIGGFNEQLDTCEDYDISLRLQNYGRIVADSRIRAVHHGEASTVRHFFRKEYWRATSNYKRLTSHSINWREIPSLLLPPIYLMFAALTALSILIGAVIGGKFPINWLWTLLMIWQMPIALLAIWKLRTGLRTVRFLQLYVLLNVYFFARGLAVLKAR